jgi:hypothetical protein
MDADTTHACEVCALQSSSFAVRGRDPNSTFKLLN